MQIEKAVTWSENTLIIFGLMKLVLIAFFFASFSLVQLPEAHSQSGDACKGRNLLVDLKRDDPAAYDAVVAEAAETENAEAIFWKVEKEGLQTSWLYGTMHLADPDISSIPEDAQRAILESETLVIESVDALDAAAAAKAMAGLTHLTFLKDGTLRDLVADELEDELEAAVTVRGVPMQLADRMQPWLVATTISLPVCEIIRKQQGAKVLDAELAHFAKENGKAIEGLETVSEQLTAISSLPTEYHVSALEETLASGSKALDMIETMKVLYLEGKMGLVFPIMKAVMPDTGSGQGVAQFQEALIDKRNYTMAERVEPVLQAGPAFVAVGALHLPGELGLVNLLRQSGYTVTAVR
ncbi:MAG: TraB/GumN family protein [Pseudomonadota bacterium]